MKKKELIESLKRLAADVTAIAEALRHIHSKRPGQGLPLLREAVTAKQ